MDAALSFVNSMAQGQQHASGSGWGSVFKNTDLSPRTQAHLVRVYATLALALFATVIGAVADVSLRVGGALSAIAGVLCLIALAMQPKEEVQTRLGLLGLYGFVQGLSLGPLIRLAIAVDPAILVTAALGTCTVFACFSLSAIYSPRRSYIYLGGMLASACTFMALISLVSIFYRPVFIFNIQLYFGLAVFCAYVLYDTQLMIEKSENGSDDFVRHALELFVNFVAIFVRLLIILLQNSQKKENNKRNNNRR